MSTFAISNIGSNTTEDNNTIPLILGGYSEKHLSEGAATNYKDMSGLLDEIYGNFDTTNSSITANPRLESEITTSRKESVQSQEIKDFNTINEFAGKLLNNQKAEPIDAQKVTYNKFWDLF
jgi:hypothetical protein